VVRRSTGGEGGLERGEVQKKQPGWRKRSPDWKRNGHWKEQKQAQRKSGKI